MIGTVDRVHEGVDYPGINVASMACVQHSHECKCCEKFHFDHLNFMIVKESLLGFNLALVYYIQSFPLFMYPKAVS